MTRNLKTLGLALVAVFAMSAVVAQAAMAEGTITTGGGYTGTIQGTQTGSNVLAIGIREIKCTGAELTGSLNEKENKTEGKATITPTYTGCTGALETTAEVTTNGCDYKLSGTGIVEGTRSFDIEIGKCATGMLIHVYNSSGTKICEYEIPVGTVIKGGLAHNEAASAPYGKTFAKLTLNGLSVPGIKVLSGTALLCGGKAGTTVEGKYTGNIDAQAKNGLGEEIGLMVE